MPPAQLLALWRRFDDLFDESMDAAINQVQAKQMLMERANDWATSAMPERVYLAYEQFLIATASLHRAQADGEISQMGDWAAWALAEEPVEHHVQSLSIGRLDEFRLQNEISSSPGYEVASALYFSGLYDYARRRSAFKEICQEFWQDSLRIFNRLTAQHELHIQQAISYVGCVMFTWAAREWPEKAAELVEIFEKLVSSKHLRPEIRGLFCKTLSTTAGRYSSQPIAYWANRALAEFDASLSNLDRVQMMVTVLNLEGKGRIDAEAVLKQMAVVREQRSAGITTLEATRNAGQTSEYIAPYFVRTMKFLTPDLVLKGLQAWYRQSDATDPLDPNSVLFGMPFGESSSMLLCGTDLRELVRVTQDPLVSVSRKMMEFLNTYTTVAGADNSDLTAPNKDRVGYPQERVAGLFEALQNAYCPEGLDVPGSATCQLIFPPEGHPVQATQLAVWGKTFPICSSLAGPRPDRTPRSILIWCGDVMSGEMELMMIEAAFRKVGATVKIVKPDTSTPEEFLKEYETGNYDVFWVSSHGELDHWSPHEIQLRLACDKSAVTLDDLWNRVPESDGRRLLVLNICDGARFGDPGLLPRVGFAAGLADPKQATVSHLWPVRPLPSAAFGAYLAHGVASGMSYFEAYCASLTALRKPAFDVGAHLETLYGDQFQLVKSLKSSNADFSHIETWGSAAFFQ